MCDTSTINDTGSIRYNMDNNMDSRQENGIMPVSPAVLGVLPYDVGIRFKESLKQTALNHDMIDECNKKLIKLIRKKKEKIMRNRFNDFYDAYIFLQDHGICKCKPYINGKIADYENNYFVRCLDVEVVKVNPETNTVDNDTSKNTKTQVWLEFGAAFLALDISEHVRFEHDTRLDCGADTFEEAIINLANLVDKYYLDNGEEKQGATCNDIKVEFTQYIAKDNKDLLLTKTDIYNKYDRHLKTRTSIIKLSTGEVMYNGLEYNYDWEVILEG